MSGTPILDDQDGDFGGQLLHRRPVLEAIFGEVGAARLQRHAGLDRRGIDAHHLRVGQPRFQRPDGREFAGEVEVVRFVGGLGADQPHLLELVEPARELLVRVMAQPAANDVDMGVAIDQLQDPAMVLLERRPRALHGTPAGLGEEVDFAGRRHGGGCLHRVQPCSSVFTMTLAGACVGRIRAAIAAPVLIAAS